MNGKRNVQQDNHVATWRVDRGVTRGGKGGTTPRTPSHYGGDKSLRRAPKTPNNVTSTSFNTVVDVGVNPNPPPLHTPLTVAASLSTFFIFNTYRSWKSVLKNATCDRVPYFLCPPICQRPQMHKNTDGKKHSMINKKMISYSTVGFSFWKQRYIVATNPPAVTTLVWVKQLARALISYFIVNRHWTNGLKVRCSNEWQWRGKKSWLTQHIPDHDEFKAVSIVAAVPQIAKLSFTRCREV